MKARVIFGTLCMMMIATCMVAQSTMLQADIPFQFYVGDKALPAGHYTLLQVSDRATILQLDDSNVGSAFVTHPAERSENGAKPVMVFRQIGGVHFLKQIWKDYGTAGRELAISKKQVQVAREGLPGSEVVLAMVRK